MDPETFTFDKFVANESIVIPFYQRRYEWKERLCDQLLKDLIELSHNPGKYHFFGTILYSGKNRTSLIIDGQQRIISVSLLLCALRDLISESELQNARSTLIEEINEHLLKSKGNPLVTAIKADQPAYKNAILGLHEKDDYDSTVTINYLFFKKHLQQRLNDFDPNELFDAIKRLRLVIIGLDPVEDDPQGVFDSINSKMQELDDGDRIRNYLFMFRTQEEQDKIYSTYWINIERNVDKLTDFFRWFIAIHTGSVPSEKRMYPVFKRKFEKHLRENHENYESFYKVLWEYSEIYNKLLKPEKFHDSTLTRCVLHINRLNAKYTYPFLMRLLWEVQNNDFLSKAELRESFKIIHNYVIRFKINSLEVKAKVWDSLDRAMATLFKTIQDYAGKGTFVEKLKYALLSKGGRIVYPEDKTIKETLLSSEIYKENPTLCGVVLTMIENTNGNSEDYVQRIRNKTISIEHIAPREKSPEWEAYLGEESAEIYAYWIHRLGNLTLSAFNSELARKLFDEKKNHKEIGYIHSNTYLDSTLKDVEIWNRGAIEKRTAILVDRFLENVPQLTTTFKPILAPTETLGIHEDFCDKTVIGYIFDGNKKDCEVAMDAYLGILRDLNDYYPKGIRTVSINQDTKEPMFVDEKTLNSKIERTGRYKPIGNGFYACTDYTDFNKFTMIARVFDELELDYDLVSIIVKNKSCKAQQSVLSY